MTAVFRFLKDLLLLLPEFVTQNSMIAGQSCTATKNALLDVIKENR
jgi:hypothetical protein